MSDPIIVMTPDQLTRLVRDAVAEGVRAAIREQQGDPNELLDARQVADLLGCSVDTWYRRAAERGAPPSIGGVRNRRWRRGAVLDWLRRQERRTGRTHRPLIGA